MIDSKYGWRNVKVAMLVRNFSSHGGLELYTYCLVQELLARGLHITVICEKSEAPLSHDNLKVIRIKPAKPKANKVSQIEHYIQEFTQAINDYGPFDIVHSQHTAAHNVDVVTFHNHTVSRLNQAGTPIEAILNKFKLFLRPDYIMRDEVDAMLAREARVLLFPSKICKQDFIEHFKFHDKRNMASLTVAYPGWQLAEPNLASNNTNPIKSVLNTRANNIPKEKTIIFVGRGYRKKGLDTLLAACILLKQRKYTFKLLIAGLNKKFLDTWQLNVFGLSNEIHYLGFVKDMETVYRAGSIIALPSRVEPFGMAVVQAMSYGLVPVVSKVAGVAELLHNENDALLIENHLDSEELAQKLALLLDQPQQLKIMSEAAQATAQTISWQGTVESTLNAYQQIFQKKYVF